MSNGSTSQKPAPTQNGILDLQDLLSQPQPQKRTDDLNNLFDIGSRCFFYIFCLIFAEDYF